MPERSLKLNSAANTFLGEPFELKPLVSEILRTKYCVPGSIFLVEGVDRISVSRSGRWQVIRLLLGDGELCIQAIIAPDMHRFITTGDIALGAYVRCEKFDVKWKDVGEDSMVMLLVRDLITVGWNETYRALQKKDEPLPAQIPAPALQAKLAPQPKPAPDSESEVKPGPSETKFPKQPPKSGFEDYMEFDDVDEADAEEAFDAFERLMNANRPKTPQKPPPTRNAESPLPKPHTPTKATLWRKPRTPQKIETLQRPKTTQKAEPSVKPRTPQKVQALQKPNTPQKNEVPRRPQTPQRTVIAQETPTYHQAIALPRDWHNPQTPLKLTTLRQIPHLPYAQNWSCNVLAIVSYLSDIEPASLPPYRQRSVRLADPSTSKQVHLTVFLDPENFTPRVGSAVLLVGVKNHRFDGGSLKKYESDRKDGRWWFENPIEMDWCDVEGINDWWAQVTAATQGRR
ncbi:cyclin f-box [Fusarium sp. NRRL 52700]|nr:cyclin f-box [Fusarium sp. NRRL 52700]